MSDHLSCTICGATGSEDSKCTCLQRTAPGWLSKPNVLATELAAHSKQAVCRNCRAVLGTPCACKRPWESVEIEGIPVSEEIAVRVEGRLRKPVARMAPCDDEVFIHIDDEENDEFWCNVHLPRETLLAALRMLDNNR